MAAPTPALRKFLSVIRRFEFLIVMVLMLLMMLVVAVSLMELGLVIYRDLILGSTRILQDHEMLAVLGFFMMVLIALELLETIKNYLTENSLHVEVVLLVALIAVARKVIILDMKELAPLTLFGIAALVISLAGSYALMRRIPLPPSETTPSGQNPS